MADSKATRNSQSVNRLDTGGGGSSDHATLTNREIADQHPIAAITGLQAELDSKQDTLVSATNIKTINGASVLGSGDLVVAGVGSGANLAYVATPTDGTITSDTGTDATIPAGSEVNASLMLPADKTKLNGVATGATANSSDVTLLDRANHTGTQPAGTITGLATVATSGAYADLSGNPDLSIYEQKIPARRTITAAADVLSTDRSIISDVASAHNITITDTLNGGVSDGFTALIKWYGAGTPSIAVTGSQTVNGGTTAIPMTARYQAVVIEKITANTWIVTGAI